MHLSADRTSIGYSHARKLEDTHSLGVNIAFIFMESATAAKMRNTAARKNST